MHMLIFGGFGVLLVGTSLDAIHTHVYHFLEGNIYLVFSLVRATWVVCWSWPALGMAAYRRYVVRPTKLNNVLDDCCGAVVDSRDHASPATWSKACASSATEMDVHPGWSVWSPVGLVFAEAFRPLGHERPTDAPQDVLVDAHVHRHGRHGLRRPQLHEAGAHRRLAAQHVPAHAADQQGRAEAD